MFDLALLLMLLLWVKFLWLRFHNVQVAFVVFFWPQESRDLKCLPYWGKQISLCFYTIGTFYWYFLDSNFQYSTSVFISRNTYIVFVLREIKIKSIRGREPT